MVFHGRKDLGTIQTYVAHGGRGAGEAVGKDELLRVPVRPRPRRRRGPRGGRAPVRRAGRALRDALVGADTVLDIWREPLEDLAHDHVRVDRRIRLDVRLPAHRLLPTALVSPEKQIVVTAVCGARPLAEGRPPMGIAVRASRTSCASTRCRTTPSAASTDFLELAAEHAHALAEQLGRQEASVQRFLELSGDDFHQTG